MSMKKGPHLYEQRAPRAYTVPEAQHAYTQYGVGYHSKKGTSLAEPIIHSPQKQVAYPPKDYFLFSLLVAIFCCAPFGLLSLFFVFRSRKAVEVADESTALHSAKWAWRLAVWGLGIGIGLTVLCVGIIAVLASTRCEKSSWSCVELVFSPEE